MDERLFVHKKANRIAVIGFIIFIAVAGAFSYTSIFGAPRKQAELESFIVPLERETSETIKVLYEQGFVRSSLGFRAVLGNSTIGPGGYKVSRAMNAWDIARTFKAGPYMKWVIIPEGLRKEQIADLLKEALRWSDEDKKNWVTKFTAMKFDEVEGVYFPDTYLIPTGELPLDTANRLRSKFNEKFKRYAQEALIQNIKWTTLVTFASIVEREAMSREDMSLVAGIMWNRLHNDMNLEVDATIQYIRDSVVHYGEAPSNSQLANYSSEGGWWTPIVSEDKNISSPYNTYRNKGLPPHPIANPGINAIKAVLRPEKTECLFYLHDTLKVIHCAKTLEEHQANIAKYLK